RVIAALTFAGVKGIWRTRAPLASNTAFAIAANVGRLDGSPAPPGGRSGRLISTISTTGGTSDARATGYVFQSTLVTLLRSNRTSSFIVLPSDCTRLAAIVDFSASGLTINPQSCEQTIRVTFTSPVLRLTCTSAIVPT